MRKSTLTFILLIAAVLCFAQKSSLKKYYYWINRAELAICDSDFQRASDCYDKAFDQHRPFNGHVYYAFKVNTQFVHNNERALRYFHILCQSGDDIEWYREDSVIYASIWPQMKMIADTTKTMVIPVLEEALENIRTSDQKVRRQMYEDDETEYNTIRYTDSINLVLLKDLYHRYPEISDYTAGMTPALQAFYTHAAITLLFDPQDILYNEVLKGNVEASRYVNLEDNCRCEFLNPSFGINTSSVYGTNVTYSFVIDSVGFVIQPDNVKEVNANRKKINLSETWRDYAKKMAFLYMNDSEFSFYPIKYQYYMQDEALQKIAEIKDLIDKGVIKGNYYIIPQALR